MYHPGRMWGKENTAQYTHVCVVNIIIQSCRNLWSQRYISHKKICSFNRSVSSMLSWQMVYPCLILFVLATTFSFQIIAPSYLRMSFTTNSCGILSTHFWCFWMDHHFFRYIHLQWWERTSTWVPTVCQWHFRPLACTQNYLISYKAQVNTCQLNLSHSAMF